MRYRTVECKQITAAGNDKKLPDQFCAGQTPETSRSCNRNKCGGKRTNSKSPIIKTQGDQDYHQSKFMKKLTLKVRE